MMLKTLYKQVLTKPYWINATSSSAFSSTQTVSADSNQKSTTTLKPKAKKQSPQKAIVRTQTVQEKIEEIDIDESTGVVTHKHLLSQDGLTRRNFPSVETFNNWMGSQRRRMKQDLRQKLTPLQYFVTQGKGMERAFTGVYWETKDVGMYSCIVCTQRLFMFDHKFQNTSGYPTFWNGIKDSIRFQEDNLQVPESTNAVEDPILQLKTPIKRCTCSNCEAHLGHLYADGPAPLGLRFQINSAALNFNKKSWFQIPKLDKVQFRKVRQEKERAHEGLKRFQELLDDEKALGFDNYLVRAIEQKERQAAQKAEPIKQTMFDVKGQQSKI